MKPLRNLLTWFSAGLQDIRRSLFPDPYPLPKDDRRLWGHQFQRMCVALDSDFKEHGCALSVIIGFDGSTGTWTGEASDDCSEDGSGYRIVRDQDSPYEALRRVMETR